MGRLTSLVEASLRRLVRRLPAGSRELGEALLAEADAVPPDGRRTRWLLGGLAFALGELARPRALAYAVSLAAAVAALVAADARANADVGSQTCLALLLLESAALVATHAAAAVRRRLARHHADR